METNILQEKAPRAPGFSLPEDDMNIDLRTSLEQAIQGSLTNEDSAMALESRTSLEQAIHGKTPDGNNLAGSQ